MDIENIITSQVAAALGAQQLQLIQLSAQLQVLTAQLQDKQKESPSDGEVAATVSQPG